MNRIIVIDGYCGSGKTTLASRIAQKTNSLRMSTGELHRINAYLIKKNKICVDNIEELEKYLKSIHIQNYIVDNQIRFSIDGLRITDIANFLTDKELVYATSNRMICDFFSRYFLNDLNYSRQIIVEGHGIANGTFKEAGMKFFLNASLEVRAKRRSIQNGIEYIEAYEAMKLRDQKDTERKINPVKISKDMIIVDAETYDIESCEKYIMEEIKMRNILENDKTIRERAKKIGIEVTKVNIVKRDNFEKEDARDTEIIFLTYYCITDNRMLLGSGGNVFKEVYPRLKKIKADLLSDTVQVEGIGYEFIIDLNDKCYDGECYEKATINSYGDTLIKMDELMKNNSYYEKLGKEFSILYGVKTNNGTVIGPDAGLIYGAKYIGQAMKAKSIRMAEIGAGTCSTPLSLSEYKKIDYYYGVDFSNKMKEQYENIFKKHLKNINIESHFVIGDAQKCELPENIDLLVVGIYYEAQYDFIVNRGADIKKAMTEDGFLMLQSGLPENTMFSDLLVTNEKDKWPWQKNGLNLRNYFSCIAQINFNDEIVTVATDNRGDFVSLLQEVIAAGFSIENIIY